MESARGANFTHMVAGLESWSRLRLDASRLKEEILGSWPEIYGARRRVYAKSKRRKSGDLHQQAILLEKIRPSVYRWYCGTR